MSRITGRFFQRKRLDRNWTLPDLARRMPHWNSNQACSRIIAFERGERELDAESRKRLAAALEIGSEELARLSCLEREALSREFKQWQARPGANRFYYRALPCLYLRQAIPEHLRTDGEVIDFARRFSREWGVVAWLYLGRRERLALRDGRVTRRRPFTWRNFREPDFGVRIR